MSRIKLIVIGLIVSIIFFIFIIVSFLFPTTPSNPNPTTPAPTSNEFKPGELSIISIDPKDTSKTFLPIQPIEITFTMPVSKNSILYTTEPLTDSFVSEGNKDNSLIISPTTIWSSGVTQINITGAISTSGENLINPQRYILKTAIPTIPDNLEGAY